MKMVTLFQGFMKHLIGPDEDGDLISGLYEAPHARAFRGKSGAQHGHESRSVRGNRENTSFQRLLVCILRLFHIFSRLRAFKQIPANDS